ncbi:ribonuclease H2, subunit C [Dichomitus squalens]|uniref:Ribonuclease H2, subunit C n=2 Tax=Dichomitus squalens TaxID=114155 RepID=A0A4Q9PIZ9_9APHY|nr:uncharacterized protein DICSQDRAFT_184290 [Dichomitus squalens LYAD-421 SS1]EJF55300.1 hypothetical protein DICSQDRAFT_184290 [Dichomitus squalens LYAD-421 SS1]TBU45389.1 ribonuclease H2, subunit C [Dichomitus squalens]TBU54042.1 ribonuclease H2, subunit C [Dichomitus squalens]
MYKPNSTLKLALSERPPPTHTPHLMPFHIAYSGPAPISTYLRVNSAPEPTYGRDIRPLPKPLLSSESQDSTVSQTTLVADSTDASSSSVATLASTSTLMDVDVEKSECDATAAPHPEMRHFAASFRGRAMHGVEVNLPEGYAGIVLRTPDDAKGKGVASRDTRREEKRPKPKGRATRRSKRAQEPEVVEVEDTDEDAGMMDGSTPSEEGPARVLRPVSTFSSFVLWHPDIPVDEGRDEYLRSLTEWTRLAAEIHRVEEC